MTMQQVQQHYPRQAIIKAFSFLDANLASANLSRMHRARGYGAAWGFPVRDVIQL